MTKPSPYHFPDRIEKVAADIYNDVIKDHENEPISALCVLKGGYKFFTDVLNKMTQLNSIGDKSVQISTEFIRLKSYVDERYENLPGISCKCNTGLSILISPSVSLHQHSNDNIIQIMQKVKLLQSAKWKQIFGQTLQVPSFSQHLESHLLVHFDGWNL